METEYGSCPAPMATGETASGKSTCLRLIQHLLGGVFLSQSSGESVTSELRKSTLPVYWDDPAHPNTLKKVLVSTFQGGGEQTKCGGNEVPLTTFLMTVNFTLDDDMRAFERTTPIMFQKIITGNGHGHMDFLDNKKRVMALASSQCIPSIIKMGRDLEECNLEEHIHFFTSKLNGLPSRLPYIYSCYRYFSFKIIDLVADDQIISRCQFDDYLVKKLIPYVTMLYGKSRKVKATIEQLMKDIVAAVEDGELIENVSSWLKPNVKQRSNQGHHAATVHMNRRHLLTTLANAGTPYMTEHIRQMCSEISGANWDFRSQFGGKVQKDIAVKLPRESIDENIMKIVDFWFDKRTEEKCEEAEKSVEDSVEIDFVGLESPCSEEDVECPRCWELQEKVIVTTKRNTELEKLSNNHQEKMKMLESAVQTGKKNCERLSFELDLARKENENLREEFASLTRRQSSKRTSVPEAVAELIEGITGAGCTSTAGQPSLNDSGVFEGDICNEDTNEKISMQNAPPQDNNKKRKLAGQKDTCNLCDSRKKSGMLMCSTCKQWQHFKCAGVLLKNYRADFICKDCR